MNPRGHKDVAERFRQSLAAGRLASTYLFVGPVGVGKRTFAHWLARALLCQQSNQTVLDPCGACESCKLMDAGSHPDLLTVSKPEDKSDIPLRLLIGEKEKRMQEGLCHDIALRPFLGGRKVAIVDDADDLNREGANALLKTLEEPPPRSVLILIGTSAARQLPTIRSRCQIVRFSPLAEADVVEILIETGAVEDRDKAERLARASGGGITRALEMSDPEVEAFRERFWQSLSAARPDGARLASQVAALVDAAGREAPPRRARLRQVIGFAAEYYRVRMRATCGLLPEGDGPLHAAVESGLAARTDNGLESAEALARCEEALEQLDRNANMATLIECWVDDLTRIAVVQALA